MRLIPIFRLRHSLDAVVFNHTSGDLGESEFPKKGEEMEPGPGLVTVYPFRRPLTIGDDFIFPLKLLCGVLEQLLIEEFPALLFPAEFKIPVLGDPWRG
ncbi:MAG: hypothetical protein AAF557_15045 [Pseudomonadota bacterium]